MANEQELELDDQDLVSSIEVEEPETEEQETPQDSPEDIARAQRMGWIPKDQFKGDPAKHRSAKEFLERGETVLPIAVERLKKLDAEIVEIKKGQKEFIEFTRAAARREAQKEFDTKLAELQAKKDEAFDAGDKEAFNEVEKEIQKLEKPVERENVKAEPPPEFKEWFEKNEWYRTDKKMQATADKIGELIQTEHELETGETLVGIPLLNKVREEMEKRYPAKFENPRRNNPASVGGAGGNRQGGGNGKGKSFNDLPPEAKLTCSNFVRQGLMTKEEYLRDYDWS